MLPADQQLAELRRGAAEVLLEADLLKKLARGKPLSTRRRRTCTSGIRS
jgi:hypothetical protein